MQKTHKQRVKQKRRNEKNKHPLPHPHLQNEKTKTNTLKFNGLAAIPYALKPIYPSNMQNVQISLFFGCLFEFSFYRSLSTIDCCTNACTLWTYFKIDHSLCTDFVYKQCPLVSYILHRNGRCVRVCLCRLQMKILPDYVAQSNQIDFKIEYYSTFMCVEYKTMVLLNSNSFPLRFKYAQM